MWLWKIVGDVIAMHTTCCKEKIDFNKIWMVELWKYKNISGVVKLDLSVCELTYYNFQTSLQRLFIDLTSLQTIQTYILVFVLLIWSKHLFHLAIHLCAKAKRVAFLLMFSPTQHARCEFPKWKAWSSRAFVEHFARTEIIFIQQFQNDGESFV